MYYVHRINFIIKYVNVWLQNMNVLGECYSRDQVVEEALLVHCERSFGLIQIHAQLR